MKNRLNKLKKFDRIHRPGSVASKRDFSLRISRTASVYRNTPLPPGPHGRALRLILFVYDNAAKGFRLMYRALFLGATRTIINSVFSTFTLHGLPDELNMYYASFAFFADDRVNAAFSCCTAAIGNRSFNFTRTPVCPRPRSTLTVCETLTYRHAFDSRRVLRFRRTNRSPRRAVRQRWRRFTLRALTMTN